jgi:hypothetical protein
VREQIKGKRPRFLPFSMMRDFVRNDKESIFLGEELDMLFSEIEHRQESSLERLRGKTK